MAVKNLNLSYNNTPFDAEGFSEEALAPHGLAYNTQQLCNTLTRVLTRVKRIEDYYRTEANNTSFDGLYGVDEVMSAGYLMMGSGMSGSPMTRPRITTAYIKPSYYQYDKINNVMTKYYKTIYLIMTRFCGLQPAIDFDTTEIPSYQYVSAAVSYDYYARAETSLAALGIELPAYWSPERFKQADLDANPDIADGSHRVDILDESSYFHGSYFYYLTGSGYLGSNSSRWVYSLNLFGIIYAIKMSEKMWLKMISRSSGVDVTNTSTPSLYLSGIGNIKGGKLTLIRQALSEVAYYIKQNGYDIYNPGTSANSVSNGRIGKRIKKALLNRGINFATEEIADYTKDITTSSYGDNYKSDPLMIVATGFANIETPDSVASSNYWWTALVPAVHLCRRYVSRRAYVPYDYKETTNPNAFEKEGGKVAYDKSNLRVYLNSRSTCSGTKSTYTWAVKTHEYDEYYSTYYGYAYLYSLSEQLIANIANTEIGYNPGETLQQVQSTNGASCHFLNQYVFLPTLTMLGVQNKSSARGWTNVSIGLDNSSYTDADGEQYPGGCGDTEINGEYVIYEEVAEAIDLIDNAWELGNRRLQFMPNPNFTGDTKEYTELYIPTATPAHISTDSRDASIPNRIACLYLSKADGTATSSNTGITSPYTYNPCTYAFALVPFHADALCGVYKPYTNGPELSYDSSPKYK